MAWATSSSSASITGAVAAIAEASADGGTDSNQG